MVTDFNFLQNTYSSILNYFRKNNSETCVVLFSFNISKDGNVSTELGTNFDLENNMEEVITLLLSTIKRKSEKINNTIN